MTARDTFEELVCPTCSNGLLLTVSALVCERCNLTYPIENGVPFFNSPEDRTRWGSYTLDIFSQVTLCKEALPENDFYAVNYLNPQWRQVLDLGCGDGTHSAPLAKRGVQVWGVDPSPIALKRFQERGIEGLHCVGGMGEKLPFPDAYFDAAILVSVIEHLENPSPTLSEVRRVLRPGGELVVTTDGLYTYLLQGAIDCMMGRGKFDPTHVNVMSPSRLRRTLESSGFDILDELLQFPVRPRLRSLMPSFLAHPVHMKCKPRKA